jgi:hypothetical protein
VRIAHHQRGVAVLGSARDLLGGSGAATADAVLDHDRLAKRLRQRLRNDARGDIGAAAGTEADNNADRPVRPILRV